MSVRQSLYGQSLVRNANALNFSHDMSQEKHWKRDWYSPSKSVAPSTSITPSATPTPFGDERETPSAEQQQQYKFKVKVWIQDLEYKPVVDGEEEDLLDLEDYSIVKKKDTSGLSDDAIRGAVGSGEAIPGISNGGASEEAEGKQDVEKEVQPTAIEVEAPKTEESPSKEETQEPVAETKKEPKSEIQTPSEAHEQSSAGTPAEPQDKSEEKPDEAALPAKVTTEEKEPEKDAEGDVVVE